MIKSFLSVGADVLFCSTLFAALPEPDADGVSTISTSTELSASDQAKIDSLTKLDPAGETRWYRLAP